MTSPFTISDGNKLSVNGDALYHLSDEELMNCFKQFIDHIFPHKRKHQQMVCENCIFILAQSLRLQLYEDKTKVFNRLFEILYTVLSKP